MHKTAHKLFFYVLILDIQGMVSLASKGLWVKSAFISI